MKMRLHDAILLPAAVVAMASSADVATAFQQLHARQPPRSGSAARPIPSSSALFAKMNKGSSGGGGGKGFGAKKNEGSKKKKYTINDKSYGESSSSSSPSSSNSITSSSSSSSSSYTEQSMEEIQSSMINFFTKYNEWKPLFTNILLSSSSSSSALATNYLSLSERSPSSLVDEDLFGIATLENRNPWRLLPSKPTSTTSLNVISNFLDEWQQSLLDIPLDALITGENDLHFLEEGRRTIAVTRFHVLEEYYNNNNAIMDDVNDWEMELFRTCWSELAHLIMQDENDTGSIVLLPDHYFLIDDETENDGEDSAEMENESRRGLEYVREFVEHNLLRPIQWLGRESDLEITALQRGSLAVRMLYKLSDIPDLSERDSGNDEDVKL